MITPPSAEVYAEAVARSNAQAKPTGALGRLEEFGARIAACQGVCPPRPLDRVRAVVLAGDHGVAAHGVSAYPAEITPAMAYAILGGTAGINVLARQVNATVTLHDLAVAVELDAPAEVTRYKVGKGSEPIHLADALTAEQTEQALAAGTQIARDEIAAGVDLLIVGDLGIGNTTPSAALIAATLGVPADRVTGTGTGLDEAGRAHKAALIQAALDRTGGHPDDPVARLRALGSADLAAGAACMAEAARNGVPVLLDGVIAVAEAVLAESLAPGAKAWFFAGHRSPEPGQAAGLEWLGLTPVLDLGMRLGEGSGAMAAVPVLRSAVAVLRELALLSDL